MNYKAKTYNFKTRKHIINISNSFSDFKVVCLHISEAALIQSHIEQLGVPRHKEFIRPQDFSSEERPLNVNIFLRDRTQDLVIGPENTKESLTSRFLDQATP